MKIHTVSVIALLAASTAVSAEQSVFHSDRALAGEAAPPRTALLLAGPDDVDTASAFSPARLAGADVLGADGADVGAVSGIVFTSAGEIEAAVVSVGGIFGLFSHRVAIPVTELSVVESGAPGGALVVQVPLTGDELRELPRYPAAR